MKNQTSDFSQDLISKQFRDTDILQRLEGPYGNIFGKNQYDDIVCIYCKESVEKQNMNIHCGDSFHIQNMFKKIEEEKNQLQKSIKKIWNYQDAFNHEKELLVKYKRDYRQIYKNLKNFFIDTVVDSGIFFHYQRKQNIDSIKTISKLFNYLLINEIDIITGQDILKFVQEVKKVNLNALLQFAKLEQIQLSNHQIAEIKEIDFDQFVDLEQDENNAQFNQNYQENIYRFMTDMMNSAQYEVAIVMNLQLALKINQEEIYRLNFYNIHEQSSNFTIQLSNQTTVKLNKEYLLPDIQKMFLDNIGSKKDVIRGKPSNRRNTINENFNKTRKQIMNSLKNSEIDKNYRTFLQKLSLNNYKRVAKTNLREYKIFNEALEKVQSQKKQKFQVRFLIHSESKYEKAVKKLMDDQVKIEFQ